MGCIVDTAISGLLAVKAFEDGEYDIILMDCEMPDMDGFEATRVIREIEKRENRELPTPIIALTVHALDKYRERCRAAGMDDYLSKPFSPYELGSKLKNWLSQDMSQLRELNETAA